MEFKFNGISIVDLGEIIDEKLRESGVYEPSEFHITLNEREFNKLDEDLYYRNKGDSVEEFMPSEGEIDVSVGNVKFIISKKKEEGK